MAKRYVLSRGIVDVFHTCAVRVAESAAYRK
jgi:hypothetical protein